jgi:hypothetical protein
MGRLNRPSVKWIALWGSIASILSLVLFVLVPSRTTTRTRSHNVQGSGNNVAGGDISIEQAPKYRAAKVLTIPTFVYDSASPSDPTAYMQFRRTESLEQHCVGKAEKGAEITVIEERNVLGRLEAHVLILSGRLSGKSGWVDANCIQLIQLVDERTDR